MENTELIITILDKEIYQDLSSGEVNFFTVPNSSILKSKFKAEEPKTVKIRNKYSKNARAFTAEIEMTFLELNKKYRIFYIGYLKHPPQPISLKLAAHTIADSLGLESDDYHYIRATKELRTDSELHARKAADLTTYDVNVLFNKKWNDKPRDFYKYIVK